jgi:hypothetical protein
LNLGKPKKNESTAPKKPPNNSINSGCDVIFYVQAEQPKDMWFHYSDLNPETLILKDPKKDKLKGGSAWVNVAPNGATLRLRLPMTKIPFALKPWGLVDASTPLDKWPVSLSFHERHAETELGEQQRACIEKIKAIDDAALELLIRHKKDLFSKEPSEEALRDPANGRFTQSMKISVDKDTGLPLTSANGMPYPERLQCKIYRGDNDKLSGMRFAGRSNPMLINDIDGNIMDIDATNVMEMIREGSLVVPVIECSQFYVSPLGKANLIWRLVALTVVSVPENESMQKIELNFAEMDAIKRSLKPEVFEEIAVVADDIEDEPSPRPMKKGRKV